MHGEGNLPDVQTSLCTSAIRSGVNLYTYTGPMVRRCSKWQVLVMVPFRSSADLRFGVLEPRSRRGWGGGLPPPHPPPPWGWSPSGPRILGREVGVFWIHLYKQSLQQLPGNSYRLYFRICRTWSSACTDFIRNHFRCVLFILFRIIFVAYKRSPMGPEGAQGGRRAPWPKGPEGPFGPLGPLALGLLFGALGPPLGPPRFARNSRNCAARKLRCA